MGNEWRELPFTEAVQVNPKVSLKKGREYPFVDMKAVDPSWQNASESECRVFKGGGARFMPYDTLMARITPCLENGKIARFVPKVNNDGPAFGSTEFIVIRGREGVTENDFAYYLTKWQEFRNFAVSQMTGSSGRQRVPADSLAGFSVPIPELEKQRAIAHILGSLDDKIELNRQMNRTLGAMAQAIFKSWFVDFDPVRAKAEGRDPGLPKDIADLFPDSFEDSELGEIPKGWKVGTLDRIAVFKTETVQPKTVPKKQWEHYSIPAFDSGKIPIFELGQTIKSGKYRVPVNSVLASKLNPQFPRVWLPNVQDDGAAICSTEFMPFEPTHATWRPFLYELMKSDMVQREILARVTGSTGSRQRVKPKEIAVMSVLIPPQELIDSFSYRVCSIHGQVLAYIQQSMILAKTRDTLLPKLISGELHVPDAGKLLESVI